MKKRWLLWMGLLILLVEGGVLGAAVKAEELVNLGEYSIKAGPTDPSEALAMAWVEAFVYPKNVKGDNIISLGVRTTSLVTKVKAHLDFSARPVALESKDGMTWNGIASLPPNLSSGLHLVRYEIVGQKGTIRRTVEFFVTKRIDLAQKNPSVSYGEVAEFDFFPLTVATTCSITIGAKERLLYPGQKLLGISKLPWYRVQLEDGSETWISACFVKDPEEELLKEGVRAFQKEEWEKAISQFRKVLALNSKSAPAYFWLAKTYVKQGLWEEAVSSLSSALEIAPRDLEGRQLADKLAHKFLMQGNEKLKRKNFRAAAVDFRRSLDLNPNFAAAKKNLAVCLEKLHLKDEAIGQLAQPEDKKETKALAERPRLGISSESLALVRATKTFKGSNLESALKSVIALTRSLGTPVLEKGWQVRNLGEKILVSYLCEQGAGAKESFDWLVDIDTRQVFPSNENARLLMSRW
jgi:tetratricopeptide (TPR) repeat protein